MDPEDKKTGAATLPVNSYDLFTLISRIYHFLILARQRELSAHNVSPQQILVLQAIQALGAQATQVEIAKNVERKPDVVSRQLVRMQKDGLITKTQYKRKSNAIKVSLTDHGFDVLKNNNESQLIVELLSFLNDEDRQRMFADLNRTLHELMEHNGK